MGVILAFIVMIILVWRKVPLALAGVISGVVMCVLTGLPVLETMTGDFMAGTVGFVKSWFLLFLFCSIYAAAMDASGAAYSLGKAIAGKVGAKYAIWGVSLAAFLMTYGGISCFVIVFAMYPIALVVFKEANISQRLIPAAICAGAFTSPNTLIGSPAICNLIPAQALGTDAMAAPLMSVVVSVAIYIVPNIYLLWVVSRDRKRGIGFVDNARSRKVIDDNKDRPTVNAFLAFLPLVAIVAINMSGLNVLYAMLAGIALAYALFWKRINNKLETLISGTQSGINAVMTVSPAVGLGAIVKLTPFFTTVVGAVTGMSGSPLISWAIANIVLSFVCSSGSAAQTMANELLADTYLAMGCNPAVLHRISSVAVLAPSATPWNGTMCVTMGACDQSHKDSYLHLIMTYVVAWLTGTVIAIAMGILIY